MTTDSPPTLPSKRQLLNATAVSALVAAVVLVVAVLPAEHGVDPTGVGSLLGLTPLSGGTGGGEPDSLVVAPPTGGLTDEVYALEARWTLHEKLLHAKAGYVTAASTEARVNVPVSLRNVTRLNAALTWTDDAPATAPDLFEISIRAPDGRVSQLVKGENPQGGEGNLSTFLQWRGVPFPEVENGSGVTFANGPADTSAEGNWTILVRLYRTGGTEAAPDRGNAFNLTVTAETYALALEERAGRAPGDGVTLTLQPNQHVEYKFELQEGAEMEYVWEATGALYYDFHGDPLPPRGDEFTSYREATGTGDEGVLKAPFTGRHGWFWWNKGQEPVTITLKTAGDYAVIGVV